MIHANSTGEPAAALADEATKKSFGWKSIVDAMVSVLLVAGFLFGGSISVAGEKFDKNASSTIKSVQGKDSVDAILDDDLSESEARKKTSNDPATPDNPIIPSTERNLIEKENKDSEVDKNEEQNSLILVNGSGNRNGFFGKKRVKTLNESDLLTFRNKGLKASAIEINRNNPPDTNTSQPRIAP